mgnify:CR=1 FL=1
MDYLELDLREIPKISLAHYYCSDYYDSGLRSMMGIEVMYTKKGKLNTKIKNNQFVMEPGDVSVLPLYEPHRMVTEGPDFGQYAVEFWVQGDHRQITEEEFSYHAMTMLRQGEKAREIYHGKLYLPFCSNVGIGSVVEGFFQDMIKEYTTYSPCGDSAAVSLLLQMLLTISRSEIARYSQQAEEHRYSHSTIEQVIMYVSEHYGQIESIRDIASHVGLNASYLGTLFKRQTGISLVSYLNRTRVSWAKMLLEAGELSCQEIATAVGVPNSYYFSTLFKKHTGMTMLEFARISR